MIEIIAVLGFFIAFAAPGVALVMVVILDMRSAARSDKE